MKWWKQRFGKLFRGWSEPFKKRLRAKGVSGLIQRLESFFERLPDKKNSPTYSYDWLYYVQCRDALHIIESIVPKDAWDLVAPDVDALDHTMKENWVNGESVFFVASSAERSFLVVLWIADRRAALTGNDS